MSAIFISHSARDNEVADELRSWLAARGYRSLFLDFDPEVGIPAGRQWEQELYRQLRACRAVIVLCSEHSMASDWCFAEITHARALGKQIFPLRIAPCKLRASLLELQVIDAVTDRPAALERLLRGLKVAGLEHLFAWDPQRSPYPGLMAFQESDAAVFFGRDAEIRATLDALTRLRRFDGSRLLVFLGASGSGKSSLLRAGILPRLRQASDTWIVLPPLRPLKRPIDELAMLIASALGTGSAPQDWKALAARLEAAATSRAEAAALWSDCLRDLRHRGGAADRSVVVCVDQLEEALVDTAQARGFLALIAALAADPDRQVVVLATLRSDFLEMLQKHPALREPYDTLPIGALGVDALTEVIEGPAQVAGLDVERGLTRLLLADTDTEDGLPLLAFVLRELWERDAKSGRLSLDTYRDALGGLQGAVARAAELAVAIDRLDGEAQRSLREAFLAMVRINESGQYTRQATRWDDLPVAVHPLVERYVEARLLVAGSEPQGRIVEVAHEALFRVWKRLRDWLDADRELLRRRDSLRRAAAEWHERERSPELLVHRGSRLEAAESLLREGRFALEDVQREYLQACIDAREALRAAERAQAAARRRRVQLTIGSLALGLCAAVALSLWAIKERRQATERLADLHFVSGVADRDVTSDPSKALHHFMRAATLAGDAQDARSAAVAGQLLAGSARLHAVVEPPNGVDRAAFGPDASRLLVWSANGHASQWTLGDAAPVAHMLHEGGAGRPIWSPDARWVWFAAGGGGRLIDGSSGREFIVVPRADGEPVFDAAEARIAVRDGRSVRVWAASRTSPLAELDHPQPVLGAVFSRDGRHLLTWDAARKARIWALDPAAAPSELDAPVEIAGAVLADGGESAFLWGRQAPAWLWHASRASKVPLRVDDDKVPAFAGAALLPGDRRLLTWNYGGVGVARLWDADSGAEVARFEHDQEIRSALADRTGGRLLTWSDDGSARVWDVARHALIARVDHDAQVRGARFDASQTRILTWSEDGTARVWDAGTGFALTLPLRHAGVVQGGRWGPGDHALLTWDASAARIWRLDAGHEAIGAWPTATPVMRADFAPRDGAEVIAVTSDGRLQRWRSGKPLDTPIKLPGKPAGAAFDAQRQQVALWGSAHAVTVHRLDNGQAVGSPLQHDPSGFGVAGAAFDASGRRLLSWGDDRSLRLWDLASGRLTPPMRHPAPVVGAEFAPDGAQALSWADDRVVRLWNLNDGALVRALPAAEYGIQGARLSRGGRLYVWDSNGTIRAGTDGTVAAQWSHGVDTAVLGVELSRDEKRLLSWDDRGGVRIWDTATGRAAPVVAWTADGLRGAALGHDDRIVLTWGERGARLWDARSGRPLSSAYPGVGPVMGARLSDDGRALLVWTENGMRWWDFGADLGLVPAQALRRTELRTGTRLDRNGQIEVLSADAWLPLRVGLPPDADRR